MACVYTERVVRACVRCRGLSPPVVEEEDHNAPGPTRVAVKCQMLNVTSEVNV